jgi:hypothetical protein
MLGMVIIRPFKATFDGARVDEAHAFVVPPFSPSLQDAPPICPAMDESAGQLARLGNRS